jgi:hypothetical protein
MLRGDDKGREGLSCLLLAFLLVIPAQAGIQ